MADMDQSAAIANYDTLIADLRLLLPTEFDQSTLNLSKYCDWLPDDIVRATLHGQMYPTGSLSDATALKVAKIVRAYYGEPLALLEAYRLLVARFILADKEREAKMLGKVIDEQLDPASAAGHEETEAVSAVPTLPPHTEGTDEAGVSSVFRAGMSNSMAAMAVLVSQQTTVPAEESIGCPVTDGNADAEADITATVGTETATQEGKAESFATLVEKVFETAEPILGPVLEAALGVDIIGGIKGAVEAAEEIKAAGGFVDDAKQASSEAVDIGSASGELLDASNDSGWVRDSGEKTTELRDAANEVESHIIDKRPDAGELLDTEKGVGEIRDTAVEVEEIADAVGLSGEVVGPAPQSAAPDSPPQIGDTATRFLATSSLADQPPVPSNELSTGNESKSSCGPSLPALQPTGPPLSATVRSDEWASPLFSRDGPDMSPVTSFGEAVRFASPEAYVTKIIDQRLAPLEVKLDKVADIIATLAPLRCLVQCLATCASAQAANAASAFASTAE